MKDNSNKNQEIKVGDWVKVVTPSFVLPFGSIHRVIYSSGRYVQVKINGTMWEISRFEVYETDEKPKMKIDMQKKYRMVGYGHPVRILCTDRDDNHYPVVYLYKTIHGEVLDCCDSFGMDENGGKVIEEVPEVDWSKVPVDTLIWTGGYPRYFAEYKNDHVYYFPNGTTSKTCFKMGFELTYDHPSICSLEEPK